MRCDDGRVISNIVCQALANEDITINGDGCQTRSFCFVDDMVEGLTRLIDSDFAVGMPINLGNPDELAVRELVDLIVARTGSSSRLVHRPLQIDDPRRRRPDISKARELLGWIPTIALDEGLDATIAWFKRERNRIEIPTYLVSSMIATAAE